MQALLLLAIVTFLGGAAVTGYKASLPYAGFEFSGDSYVGAVAPDGPAAAAGLQRGDRILTIDGLQPMSSGELYLHPGQGTLQLLVARDGQTLALEVTPKSPSLGTFLNRVGYSLMALGFWIIAVLVLAYKPRDSAAQFFVLLTLLGTVIIVTWSMADLGSLWANMLETV